MPLAIEVVDPRWRGQRGLAARIKAAYESALPKALHKRDVTLLLSDDAALRQLNKQWRGKDKPTNVLSFPASIAGLPKAAPLPLGDIAIAFDTVKKEAAAAGKTIANHTLHLVVHGLLHLTGHDHENEAEAQLMEKKEIRILRTLGIANPYVLDNSDE